MQTALKCHKEEARLNPPLFVQKCLKVNKDKRIIGSGAL